MQSSMSSHVIFYSSISANFSSTTLWTMSLSYRESIPRTVKQTTDFLLLHTSGRQEKIEDDDTNHSRKQGQGCNSLPLHSSSVPVVGPRTRVVSGTEWKVLLSNMTSLVANNFTDNPTYTRTIDKDYVKKLWTAVGKSISCAFSTVENSICAIFRKSKKQDTFFKGQSLYTLMETSTVVHVKTYGSNEWETMRFN